MAIIGYKTNVGFGVIDLTYEGGDIFINGQAYNPVTLAPIFGKTIQSYHSSILSNYLLPYSKGKKCVNITPYGTGSFGSHTLLSRDSTTFDLGQGMVSSIYKSTYTNNYHIPLPQFNNDSFITNAYYSVVDQNTLLQTTYTNSSSVNTEELVVDEDSTNIYTLGKQCANSAAAGSVFHAKSKPGWNTNGVSILSAFINTGQRGDLYLLSQTPTYWFFGAVGHVYNTNTVQTLSLHAVNKSTRVLTTIVTNINVNVTNGNLHPVPSNPVVSGANTKRFYIAHATGSTPAFTIKYLDYNESTLSQTNGTCVIDWTPGGGSVSTFETPAKSQIHQYTRSFTFSYNGNLYLAFGLLEPTPTATENVNAIKLYVFKIQSDFSTLDFHSVFDLSVNGRVRYITPIVSTGLKLAIIRDGNVEILNFTEMNGLGTYVSQSTIPWASPNGSLVYDAMNRLWLLDGSSNTINVFSDTVAATINCAFENSSYSYTGSDITSSIIVDAYNVSGNRIATNVQIQLTSLNVKFSDNSTIKTITTSNSGSVSVPIIITGPGQLTASANVAL